MSEYFNPEPLLAPPFPDPADHIAVPWEDPNGKLWIADVLGRWFEYLE